MSQNRFIMQPDSKNRNSWDSWDSLQAWHIVWSFHPSERKSDACTRSTKYDKRVVKSFGTCFIPRKRNVIGRFRKVLKRASVSRAHFPHKAGVRFESTFSDVCVREYCSPERRLAQIWNRPCCCCLGNSQGKSEKSTSAKWQRELGTKRSRR